MTTRSSRWPAPDAERRWTRACTSQRQQQEQQQQLSLSPNPPVNLQAGDPMQDPGSSGPEMMDAQTGTSAADGGGNDQLNLRRK